MNVFWAQHGRLYHAIEEGAPKKPVNQGNALCGRYIPPPRMTSKTPPLDDERCAKCDKAIRESGSDALKEQGADAEVRGRKNG